MSLYKRGKTYYMNIMVNGKRINKSTGKSTKREASRVMEQEREAEYKRSSMLDAFKSGIFESMPDLRTAGEQVYEDKWRKNKRSQEPLTMVEFICDNFENPKLNEIDKQWIYRLNSYLSKGRKEATVNRYMARMRTVLRHARDQWEILDRIPKISLPKENNQRTRTIEWEEQDAMTALLRANMVKLRPYDPLVADLIDVLCDTGMRLSEALTLGPKNFVKPGMVLLYPEDTKSNKVRSVPLTEKAQEIFSQLKKHPFKTLDKSNSRRSFLWAKKQLGITDLEFCLHACRHTFASRLLQSGNVGLYEVKELLGHASITTTQRYSHLAISHLERAVGQLNNHQQCRQQKEI